MASPKKLLFVCEGKSDQTIIGRTLKYAEYDVEYDFLAQGGQISPTDLVHSSGKRTSKLARSLDDIRQKETYQDILVVYDIDIGRPSDAVHQLLQIDGYWIVPNSPTIEAWVLSDRNAYERALDGVTSTQIFTYEDYMSVGDPSTYDFSFRSAAKRMTPAVLTAYDPLSAAVVCPSLRNFLNIMDRVCGGLTRSLHFNFSRTLLEKLVLEYYPEDKLIYKSLDTGNFTGKQMAEQINLDTPVGRKYASDLLRVCRDALARQANKDC